MRRTRLVILPGARCLTRICCLLLYLSCPNIGALSREQLDLSREDLYLKSVREVYGNTGSIKEGDGMCFVSESRINCKTGYDGIHDDYNKNSTFDDSVTLNPITPIEHCGIAMCEELEVQPQSGVDHSQIRNQNGIDIAHSTRRDIRIGGRNRLLPKNLERRTLTTSDRRLLRDSTGFEVSARNDYSRSYRSSRRDIRDNGLRRSSDRIRSEHDRQTTRRLDRNSDERRQTRDRITTERSNLDEFARRRSASNIDSRRAIEFRNLERRSFSGADNRRHGRFDRTTSKPIDIRRQSTRNEEVNGSIERRQRSTSRDERRNMRLVEADRRSSERAARMNNLDESDRRRIVREERTIRQSPQRELSNRFSEMNDKIHESRSSNDAHRDDKRVLTGRFDRDNRQDSSLNRRQISLYPARKISNNRRIRENVNEQARENMRETERRLSRREQQENIHQRVALSSDRSVVKKFRAVGSTQQQRLNRVSNFDIRMNDNDRVERRQRDVRHIQGSSLNLGNSGKENLKIVTSRNNLNTNLRESAGVVRENNGRISRNEDNIRRVTSHRSLYNRIDSTTHSSERIIGNRFRESIRVDRTQKQLNTDERIDARLDSRYRSNSFRRNIPQVEVKVYSQQVASTNRRDDLRLQPNYRNERRVSVDADRFRNQNQRERLFETRSSLRRVENLERREIQDTRLRVTDRLSGRDSRERISTKTARDVTSRRSLPDSNLRRTENENRRQINERQPNDRFARRNEHAVNTRVSNRILQERSPEERRSESERRQFAPVETTRRYLTVRRTSREVNRESRLFREPSLARSVENRREELNSRREIKIRLTENRRDSIDSRRNDNRREREHYLNRFTNERSERAIQDSRTTAARNREFTISDRRMAQVGLSNARGTPENEKRLYRDADNRIRTADSNRKVRQQLHRDTLSYTISSNSRRNDLRRTSFDRDADRNTRRIDETRRTLDVKNTIDIRTERIATFSKDRFTSSYRVRRHSPSRFEIRKNTERLNHRSRESRNTQFSNLQMENRVTLKSEENTGRNFSAPINMQERNLNRILISRDVFTKKPSIDIQENLHDYVKQNPLISYILETVSSAWTMIGKEETKAAIIGSAACIMLTSNAK